MTSRWDLNFLSIVGALSISVFLGRVARYVYVYIRPSSIDRYRQKDGWALVTGATEGIGRALSRELASRGFNVIVHGRNPAKLQAVRDELSKEFPALKFRVAVANAFLGGEESKQSINQLVKGLEDVNLKILVNNVGGLPTTIGPRYKSFEETSFWENDMMLAMNVDFPTQLTCALLPLLVKHQPSLIITLGSLAEYGNPWLSMYSGSKAFLMSWCRALARELKAEGKDVEVLGILTGEVTDCSHNKKPATLVMPDARTYARATVDKVGCGQVVVNGHFFQGFLKAVVDRLPDFIVSSSLTTAMRRMKEEDGKDA